MAARALSCGDHRRHSGPPSGFRPAGPSPPSRPARSNRPPALGAWWLAAVLVLAAPVVPAGEGPDGAAIMAQALARHERYPHVYEEQSLILMDPGGGRVSYRLRRYSRIEEDGTLRLLLVFDDPPEVRGVALRSVQPARGGGNVGIFLPALGRTLLRAGGAGPSSRFLGSDFTVGDLLPEEPADFAYRRREDRRIGEVAHFVVDAMPRGEGAGSRRHFVRQDNLYIVRTEYFDGRGRLERTRSAFDLRPVNGDTWRADMVLMVDHRTGSRSLIKVLRRVFSSDYVPRRLFRVAWLLERRHMEGPRAHFEGAPVAGEAAP